MLGTNDFFEALPLLKAIGSPLQNGWVTRVALALDATFLTRLAVRLGLITLNTTYVNQGSADMDDLSDETYSDLPPATGGTALRSRHAYHRVI